MLLLLFNTNDQEAESVIEASRRAKQEADGVQRRIQDAASRRPVSMLETSGVYYSPHSTVRRQSKDIGTVRSHIIFFFLILFPCRVRIVQYY